MLREAVTTTYMKISANEMNAGDRYLVKQYIEHGMDVIFKIVKFLTGQYKFYEHYQLEYDSLKPVFTKKESSWWLDETIFAENMKLHNFVLVLDNKVEVNLEYLKSCTVFYDT